MPTENEYKDKIQGYDEGSLVMAWNEFRRNNKSEDFWAPGKFLEYSILRAFELELHIKDDNGYPKHKGSVTYPFNVNYPKLADDECNSVLEQIDGAICVNGLYSLIECKDYTNKVKAEPLTRLRNILSRRHGNLFGMFFSLSSYTAPAQIQVQFMAPQIIILWEAEDIDYCMKNRCFIDCMLWKYHQAIEQCDYSFNYYQYLTKTQECAPLF